MASEKLILILKSSFQTEEWLREEYKELLSMLERETGLKSCIYGRDTDVSVRERIIKADIDIVLVATGGVESVFVDLEPYLARDGRPISLIADGRNNSLAAALEILTYFGNKHHSGRIVHAPTNAEIVQELLHPTSKAPAPTEAVKEQEGEGEKKKVECDMNSLLKGCKVGCFGKPSDWLIASDVDREVLSAKYGVTVVDISMERLVSKYESMDAKEVETLTKIHGSDCIHHRACARGYHAFNSSVSRLEEHLH